jgi:pilus assembly protein Flp/PilA
VGRRERFVEFLLEENAQGLVEYALILGIVSIAVLVAMFFMRDQLLAIFSNIGNTVGNAIVNDCQGQQQQGQCP